MNKHLAKRALVGVLGSGIAAGICLLGDWLPSRLGYCLNITPSEPVGIYRLIEGQPNRDALVLLKQPQNLRSSVLRAYVPANLPLIKRIAAIPGDTVEIDQGGVRVGGVLWPDSAPLSRDRQGNNLRPYHFGVYRVRISELWVMSNNPCGLDSRYFGPVSAGSIISRLIPVATWSSTFAAQILALAYALCLAGIAVIVATSIVSRLNALITMQTESSRC